jgi:hypothetical protein
MDLPPCPACGKSLDLVSPQGPATCPSCGFTGPVEVDREALGRLMEDASSKGLGPQTMLAPTKESPDPRLEGRSTPSMLDGPKAPERPRLSPPPVPRELMEGAPPPMGDPRSTLPMTRDEVTRTRLGDDIEEREGRRKRQLRGRGELLK